MIEVYNDDYVARIDLCVMKLIGSVFVEVSDKQRVARSILPARYYGWTSPNEDPEVAIRRCMKFLDGIISGELDFDTVFSVVRTVRTLILLLRMSHAFWEVYKYAFEDPVAALTMAINRRGEGGNITKEVTVSSVLDAYDNRKIDILDDDHVIALTSEPYICFTYWHWIHNLNIAEKVASMCTDTLFLIDRDNAKVYRYGSKSPLDSMMFLYDFAKGKVKPKKSKETSGVEYIAKAIGELKSRSGGGRATDYVLGLLSTITIIESASQ